MWTIGQMKWFLDEGAFELGGEPGEVVQVAPVLVIEESERGYLEEGYSDLSNQIAIYLETLQRPPEVDRKAFQAFKKKELRYAV
jgi:hypothetical protein